MPSQHLDWAHMMRTLSGEYSYTEREERYRRLLRLALKDRRVWRSKSRKQSQSSRRIAKWCQVWSSMYDDVGPLHSGVVYSFWLRHVMTWARDSLDAIGYHYAIVPHDEPQDGMDTDCPVCGKSGGH